MSKGASTQPSVDCSVPMSSCFSGRCFDTLAMRDLDRRSAAAQGLNEFDLMMHAGGAAFTYLSAIWPGATRFAVFCGTGNNGGDGWVVARLLLESGVSCDVFLHGSADRISGAALLAYEAWRQIAPERERSSDDWLNSARQGEEYDVLVDALVGIGFRGPARSEFDALVEGINGASIPVLSLDVPSGLNADTGAVDSSVIQAHSTVTFIAMKPGLLTGRAPDVAGRLILDSLDTPQFILDEVPAVAINWARDLPPAFLRPRRPTTHKGVCGHVLVVGGNTGMGGASILSASAALRSGAGLVTLATRSEHLCAAISRQPEVMARDIDCPESLFALLEKASVVVVGPGLGVDDWSAACLRIVLESHKPLVVDADALNLLATDMSFPRVTAGSVLTPHPGEAARLAKVPVSNIEADRLYWAKALARQYASSIILKGAGSIIASDKEGCEPNICSAGNSGMATAGMGDVLAGVVGALLAQGYDAPLAALGGTVAHANAGDLAWREHGIGLTATDVISHVGAVLTPGIDTAR